MWRGVEGCGGVWRGSRPCRGCALTPATPQDLKVVNSYLKSCFLIFPNYNLGHGLMEMAYNEYINEYYAKIGERHGAGQASGPHEAPAQALNWLPHRPV